ncbi:MAG: hypothetical protein MJ181_03125 [Treponema sp.]|nr:hypothetical protein [Treponema sp.]
MNIQTEKGLKEALVYLESGNPEKAHRIIDTLFDSDLESPELMYTTQICTFWTGPIRNLSNMEDPYERGESLLNEWKLFVPHMSKFGEYLPAFYAIQKGIFTLALDNYLKLFDQPVASKIKAEIYRKAGMCYKKLGSFENACRCLTEANNLNPLQAPILAELADCFSLCGDDKRSKVMFREAFFVAPDQIDTDFLDSGLIRSLIDQVKEKNYHGRLLNEWIPVFGILCGIFSIKRVMTSQEIAKLKQDIYSMEMEYKNPSSDSEVLIPRLLNSYFWLIDQYVMLQNMEAQVNEILLKIKVLDINIYSLYIK